MKVAVIGASNKEHRYSYKALMLLKEYGHEVYPVHPKIKEINGIKVYSSIKEIQDIIDSYTIYVSQKLSNVLADDLLDKKPNRIIFNPGAENPQLQNKASKKGILVIEGCTLVMLKTGQF